MSTSENSATDKGDVYRKVTSQIINAIEAGVSNWRMPWHTSGRFAFSPINVSSHKPYRGINTLCLWAAAQAKGYACGEWGTYQQWQERGAQVRKGEKATTVVFWKFAHDRAESQDDSNDTQASGSHLLFTRGYSVFNAGQVDSYTAKAESAASVEQRIESAEQFFSGIGAHLTGVSRVSADFFSQLAELVRFGGGLELRLQNFPAVSVNRDMANTGHFGNLAVRDAGEHSIDNLLALGVLVYGSCHTERPLKIIVVG